MCGPAFRHSGTLASSKLGKQSGDGAPVDSVNLQPVEPLGVVQKVALDLDIGAGLEGGFLVLQERPHNGTEGFDGPTTAFDLLASGVLAEPHARVEFGRALAGILCGDCRRRAKRNAALLGALPRLENPSRRATGPETQTPTGNGVVEFDSFALAVRHRDFRDIDLGQFHANPLSPGCGACSLLPHSVRAAGRTWSPGNLGSTWEDRKSLRNACNSQKTRLNPQNRGSMMEQKSAPCCSAFYSWAMRQGLADANPVVGTGRAVANSSRDRVLTDDELRSIWVALGNDHYGDVVKLLALTGQRRDEIGSLRWQEFDFHKAVISLPAERTKNGKPHDIPLSPTALTIIKNQPRLAGREYVFGIGANGYSGWSKSKEMLDQRIADNGPSLPAWRLHDLRRSVSTRMHDDLGIPPHIVEAVLNHISGHRAGVAGTYNRAVYAKEKTIALARWAEHLLAIVGGERTKVVAISKGKTRR
jgi:hypothetical protein